MPETRLVLRLFAAGWLVLGAAYLGFLNELRLDYYRYSYHPGLRREVIDEALSVAGYVLAAVGFWTAGRAVAKGTPSEGVEVETGEAGSSV